MIFLCSLDVVANFLFIYDFNGIFNKKEVNYVEK